MARVAVWMVAAGLCAATGAGVYAQAQVQAEGEGAGVGTKTMLVEPPAPLLPATLGDLRRVREGDAGDGLGQMDAAGLSAQDKAALTEDGLRRFARSEYAAVGSAHGSSHGSAQGAGQGLVTVYKFGDVSGAVAAYDYFRRPGMRSEKLGDAALSNGDELLLRSGANVVVGDFRLGHEAMLAVSRELIEHLPKVGGTAGLAPPLPALVPAGEMDADSVRYALGPTGYRAMGGALPSKVVGFDKSAEAVTARNRSGGVLTLLSYPTPEIAGEQERAIAELGGQQAAAENSASGHASIQASGRALAEASAKTSTQALTSGAVLAGTVKMRREGTLLLLTTGAWSEVEAERMVNGIHLRDEVTWDKPVPLDFATELHKTYSLLVGIAILSGMGCLAALVLGLFFGGGRALLRVLQGKPAASEPEFLRIDLSGATGKRLRDGEK